MAFKLGSRGLGYYSDHGLSGRTAASASAAVAAVVADAAAAGVASSKQQQQQQQEQQQQPAGWLGMQSVADLRRALGVGAPRDSDSLYRPIERGTRKFNPLKVPKSLQASLALVVVFAAQKHLPLLAGGGAGREGEDCRSSSSLLTITATLTLCDPSSWQAALPFKSKPKLEAKRRRKSLEQKRAVVLEPAERRQVNLLAQLQAIRNQKATVRREQRTRQREHQIKRHAAEEASLETYRKQERKRKAVEKGMAERRADKKAKS